MPIMWNQTLREWLEANPNEIIDDGPLLIVGRQVPTDLGKSVGLLGVDREGNLVAVELKRGRTPRDVPETRPSYNRVSTRINPVPSSISYLPIAPAPYLYYSDPYVVSCDETRLPGRST